MKLIIIDFYSRLINLNFDIFYSFLLINKYIFLYIIITYILIIFDYRFTLWRKVFIFIFLFIFLILFNMYEYIDLHLFIRELYWYSLVLNGSFILHVCWLHWIYVYFWSKRNNSKYLSIKQIEIICDFIKNISFILSLSFIVFLLNYLAVLSLLKSKKIKKLIFLIFFFRLVYHLIFTLTIIFRFFIYIFISYSNFIIGNRDTNIFNFWHLVTFGIYFIFSWFIAYYILGISRLLFNWILIFLIRFMQILKDYIQLYNEKYYHQNLSNKYFNLLKYFFFKDYEAILNEKIVKEQCIYFNEWYNKCYKENYNRPQMVYLFLNQDHTNIARNYMVKISLVNGFNIIFFEKDSWFEKAKKICIRKLAINEYKSDMEFYEELDEVSLCYNLTEAEKNNIIFDYFKHKEVIERYGRDFIDKLVKIKSDKKKDKC